MAKVLLIGDFIEDVNLYGKVTRLCPEAPVPVWTPAHGRDTRPGGMGLVAENLNALGVEVVQYALSFSRKTRFWSGKHLVLRQDEDSTERKSMDKSLLEHIKDFDAVIVSDYEKGGIPYDTARAIAYACERDGIKLFVDTKKTSPGIYRRAYCIFPNEAEAPYIVGGNFQHVIRKVGEQGCYVDDRHVPAFTVEVSDVTGAGDVFLSAFVRYNLEGYCLEDCGLFANKAASISVQHQGGYVLTQEDIKEIEQ